MAFKMCRLTWIIRYIAIFVAVLQVSATGPMEEDFKRCIRLDKAIMGFFPEEKVYQNALYESIGYEWDFYKENPQFDIYGSQAERLTFACRLLRSDNFDELIGKIGLTLETEGMFQPIKDIGGVDHLVNFARVFINLLEWAKRNGYPVLPLRLNDGDTLKTFRKVRNARKVDYMKTFIDKLPFPAKLSATDALKVLKDASSYTELETSMGLENSELAQWADWIEEEPNAIQLAIDDINSFIEFIESLDATKLLTAGLADATSDTS